MAAARDDNVLDRLRQLEARVERLESVPAGSGIRGSEATAPGQDARRGDQFWALDRLRAMSPQAGAVMFVGAVSTPGGERYEWQEAHPTAAVLDAEWGESVSRLDALAHPVRLLLLHEIVNGSRTVGELAAHERLGTTGQLYHHLRQLVAAGWLRATGQGRYEVPGERIVALLVIITASRR